MISFKMHPNFSKTSHSCSTSIRKSYFHRHQLRGGSDNGEEKGNSQLLA